MRNAVHQEPTGPADSLTAVRVEGDRILAFGNQALVDDVEHLEEGHIRRDLFDDVVDELAVSSRAGLTPHLQEDTHR